MSEALYERYKEALRRGHVAAQRGRLDEALDAYGEAGRLAPDRALPLIGIGEVLSRLGKTTEAVATYDRALERAPTDEAALRGRSDVLLASGDRAGAAETLDRLAAVQDASGLRADALDAAGRALDLAESRGRRATLQAMVDRYATAPDAAAIAADALARAKDLLASHLGPDAPPPEPPFDPAAAMAAVDEAVAIGDPEAVREAALAAARGHRGPANPTPRSMPATRRSPPTRPTLACTWPSPSSTSTGVGGRPRRRSSCCCRGSSTCRPTSRRGAGCASWPGGCPTTPDSRRSAPDPTGRRPPVSEGRDATLDERCRSSSDRSSNRSA